MAWAPLAMMGLGLMQGYMSYEQAKEQQQVARRNAEQARQGQEYELKVRDTNLILSEGQRQQTQELQDLKNNATLGTAQAKMGVSGSMGGSVLEKLADTARMGGVESAQIDFSFAEQWAGITNAGNMAIYNLERQEDAYLNQASQAGRAATMGLLSGVASGIMGVYAVGGTMGSLFSAGTATAGQTAAAMGLSGMTALSAAGGGATPENFRFTPNESMYKLDLDFGGLGGIKYGHGFGGQSAFKSLAWE